MRLAVTLLARNDGDIMAAWIEHHIAQGAGHIVVTDNGSEDGALDVLNAYADAGAIELWHEPGDDYRQSEWVSRMARHVAAEGAEWVVNADTDEFWRSATAGVTLHDELASVPGEFASVRAWRTDLRGAPGERGWLRRLTWLDRETVSERGTPLAPKLAHRGALDVTVEMGNHAASLPGGMEDAGRLEIVHVPMRSYEQLARKVRLGAAAVARNPELGEETAWHWRADARRLEDGTLHQTYLDRSLRGADLRAVRRSGRVVRERRLADELRALGPRAVLPDLLRESLRA